MEERKEEEQFYQNLLVAGDDLPENIANTPIKDLELSNRIKNSLTKRMRITTLGQLLRTDYNYFLRACRCHSYLGELAIKEIKDFIHNLGYIFPNEYPSMKEITNAKKAKGIKLLEDYGFSTRLCGALYRNGIFTLEDLQAVGSVVEKLEGVGPIKVKELYEKLEKLQIGLEDKTPETVKLANPKLVANGLEFAPTVEKMQELQQSNEEIRNRIAQKELLLKEYEEILREREDLLKKERELDDLIAKKLQELSNNKGAEINGR